MNKIDTDSTTTNRYLQGYTLIELLLYITVIGSLLVGISAFFATVADARIKNQSISEVNQQGTAAQEYLTATIRNATSISAPTTGGSSASLTLVVPTGALSPTVLDLGGTTLQVKEGAAAAMPLTNNKVQVSGLSFKNLSRSGTPGVVQITFIIDRTNTSGRNEYDYQKTFVTSAALRSP